MGGQPDAFPSDARSGIGRFCFMGGFMPRFDFQQGLIVLIAGFVLSGCTTLDARLSLEPYTLDKQKRNAVELIAENYCRQKRDYPGASAAHTAPDFIFTTDGCSRAPDDGWVSCCIAHDMAYWCGGSAADRKEVDQFLRQCLSQQAAVIGNLYYVGTRLGGMPWLPAPWRWGYGWKAWPRGYEALAHSPSAAKLLEDLHVKQAIQAHLQK
jgi:hypothetical protein